MNPFSLAIDVFLVAVFVLSVLRGYRKGFVKMMLSLVALIISGVVAAAVSPQFAQWLNDSYIRNSVVDLLTRELTNVMENDVQSLLAAVPDYIIRASDVAGISMESLLESAVEPAQIAQNIYAATEEAFILPAVKAIIFIIVFIVASIILSLAVILINSLFKHSSLKKPNAVLGAVTGAAKGIYYICILCALLEAVSFIFTGSEVAQTVDGSYIQQFVWNIIITLKEEMI